MKLLKYLLAALLAITTPAPAGWLPLTKSGGGGGPTQVRVTFQADPGGPLIVDMASIGIRAAAGNDWDTTAVPIQLLFSSNPGFNILAGASITSDWANLVISSNTGTVNAATMNAGGAGWSSYSIRNVIGPITGGAASVVVSMDFNASADFLSGVSPSVGTDSSYYFGPSTPIYNLATPPGGSITANAPRTVILIETQ